MNITIKQDGKVINRFVNIKQFPITPAYTFTDYRAQGQTIPCATDIARPATGSINLCNSLGRVPSRDSICLLRDLSDDILLPKGIPEELKGDDDRLTRLKKSQKTGTCVKQSNVSLLCFMNAISTQAHP